MIYVDGAYQISGYFHVVKKESFKDGQHVAFANPHRMSMESLGQIKLSITSNINIKRTTNANPLTRSIARENSPLNKPRNVYDDEVLGSRSIELRNFNSNEYGPQTNQTTQKLEYSFNQVSLALQNRADSDIKNVLSEKMNELDLLHKSLLLKARNSSQSPQPLDRNNTNQDFRMTMGHGQSVELRNSFQPFAYHNNQHRNDFTNQIIPPLRLNDQEVIEEAAGESEREESFRRDNVFENNISQSSNYKQDEEILRVQQEEAEALNDLLNPTGTNSNQQQQYYDTFNQKQLN